jgi:hypothetical protein
VTGASLTEQLDAMDWSEDAHALFRALTAFDAGDEGAAVLLIAAAVLLARQAPDPEDYGSLADLCGEFKGLAFTTRQRLADGRCRPERPFRPVLFVVGGTDA